MLIAIHKFRLVEVLGVVLGLPQETVHLDGALPAIGLNSRRWRIRYLVLDLSIDTDRSL